ncbi:MAG: hypothetical protein VX910_10190 [Candidatus Latescibacterota bacterium]|nr:hypothetical protein [Candidatus Latescibacterota bacterium]
MKHFSGGYRVGHWTISAEMNPQVPASMAITQARADVALGVDVSSIQIAGRAYQSSGGTVLVERCRSHRIRD